MNNWLAFFITLPVNLLLVFLMYKDIDYYIKERRRRENRFKNLRSAGNIQINISEEEKEMLDALTKFKGCKSNSQFIHSVIKEEAEDIAV